MRIYTPRVVADRIMMQDDFVRLHKFLLETDAISDISDDVREVVEKEWPELVHKLPPKNRTLDRFTPRGGPQFSRTTLLRGKWAQSIVAKLIALAASAESRRGTLSWKRQRPPNVLEALAGARTSL